MASQATRSIKAIVADNIRQARRTAGLTQSQLALQVGVESMAVSRWERAQVRPSDENLQALAQILRRDPAWFFTEQRQAA